MFSEILQFGSISYVFEEKQLQQSTLLLCDVCSNKIRDPLPKIHSQVVTGDAYETLVIQLFIAAIYKSIILFCFVLCL